MENEQLTDLSQHIQELIEELDDIKDELSDLLENWKKRLLNLHPAMKKQGSETYIPVSGISMILWRNLIFI